LINRVGLYLAAAFALFYGYKMNDIASMISAKEKPKPLDSAVTEFVARHGIEAVSFEKSGLISGLQLLALPEGAEQTRQASVKFDIPLSFEMTEQDYASDRSGNFKRIESKYAGLAEFECGYLKQAIAVNCTAVPISIKFKIVDDKKPVATGFVSFDISMSYAEQPRESNLASITHSRLVLETPELPASLGPRTEYRINPFEETLAKRKAYYNYVASSCAALRKKFGNCAILSVYIEQEPSPDFPFAFRHGVSATLGTLEDLGGPAY
jgi:hypothetical protein